MRTFIALNLKAPERTALHASLAGLRARELPVRWTPADALHLTLKFLGDTEGGDVPRIEETLRAVAAEHAPVEVAIEGFGAFPSLRRANVLWVGVAPAQPLLALQRDLELAFSRLGYGREQKPFRPHVTVARLRSGARAPDVERMAADHDYGARTTVESVDLMRSHPAGDGPRYEPLLRIRLNGAAAS
jgi:RNA 2',3'-cyclic 3'-phosphodiesterase